MDKWPFYVPRHGKEPVPFLAKHVIVTSSLPPAQVYKNREQEDSLDQLLRRVKVTDLTPVNMDTAPDPDFMQVSPWKSQFD